MIHLPKPQSSYWAKWLEGLSDAQLAAVGSWLRAGHYRRLLSPQVCWYQLCGRHDVEERERRLAVVAAQEGILGASAQDQVFGDAWESSGAVRPDNGQKQDAA